MICIPIEDANGLAARAVQKLNEDGVKVYRTIGETVSEIMDKYKQGALEEITINSACGGTQLPLTFQI